MPIIIFDNERIKNYEHQLFCKRLNTVISVFSFSDFKILLNSLFVPRDIIEYCIFRNNLFIKNPDIFSKRVVFGENNLGVIMMNNVKNEPDLIEFYVRSKYVDFEINPQILNIYNQIITQVYNNTPDVDNNKLLSILLSVDCNMACRLAKLWQTSTERGNVQAIFFSGNNNELVILASKPSTLDDEQFKNFIILSIEYYSCIKKAHEIYVFSFVKEGVNVMINTFALEFDYKKVDDKDFDSLKHLFADNNSE